MAQQGSAERLDSNSLGAGARIVAFAVALAIAPAAPTPLFGSEVEDEKEAKGTPLVAFEVTEWLTTAQLLDSEVEVGTLCRCSSRIGFVLEVQNFAGGKDRVCAVHGLPAFDCGGGIQLLRAVSYSLVTREQLQKNLNWLETDSQTRESVLLEALKTATITHAVAALIRESSDPFEDLRCASASLCPEDENSPGCCLRIRLHEALDNSSELKSIRERLKQLEERSGRAGASSNVNGQ